MTLDGTLAGRTFPPAGPYLVTAERVTEFAAALGEEYAGGPAPATFPVVAAFRALRLLTDDPAVGLAPHRLLHGEQRFTYSRPVVPGDELTTTVTVDSVRRAGDADILSLRADIVDAAGDHVVTSHTVLVHRPEQP